MKVSINNRNCTDKIHNCYDLIITTTNDAIIVSDKNGEAIAEFLITPELVNEETYSKTNFFLEFNNLREKVPMNKESVYVVF